MNLYAVYHNSCRYDKHGVPMLAEPLREIEEQLLTGCPICDGSGWTFEPGSDADDFYPCPCPLAGQLPAMHWRI